MFQSPVSAICACGSSPSQPVRYRVALQAIPACSLRGYGTALAGRRLAAQIALTGDWNIAPTDEDVWSVEFTRAAARHRPERAAFNAISTLNSPTWCGLSHRVPAIYTYWDYTQLRFPKNRGMRIDFILGSPALAQRVSHAEIVREERKGKGASDHAPVLVELG